MRRNFSPPQLPASSTPHFALPPTLRILPPPPPSPSYPSQLSRPLAPSHTITWLFFYSSTSFSIFFSFFSSSHFTLPFISFLLFLLIFFLLSLFFYICLPFSFFPFSSFPSPSCSFYLSSCHIFLRRPPPSFPHSWSPRHHFSSFSYFSPSPHSLPPPLVPSASLTPTVPQLQQAKSAERNLKRYVL